MAWILARWGNDRFRFLYDPEAIVSGLGIDHLADDELHARLGAARDAGDPLADALVAAFRELPGGAGWQLLERAFAAGPDAVPDAPRELHDLLAQASEPPAWHDQDLADAGAASIWSIGLPAVALALTYGSLAFGYQKAELARPLGMTGRLERMAPRRLAETLRWYLAVTNPGGTAPGEEGWRASVRVRLVHALVRRRLLESGTWDTSVWGMPISSAGMLVTAIGGFHVVPQRALRDLGARSTPAEREARTALWRWVGYVMGAPEDLLPANWEQAERIIEAADGFDDELENEYGAALMHALLNRPHPVEAVLPGVAAAPLRRANAAVGEALTRRWLGDDVSDGLGVRRNPAHRLVPLVRPAVRAHAALRATGLLGGEKLAAQLQIAFATRLLSFTDVPAPLSPADTEDAETLPAAA
jgi:ER-bound oxygenase mpaB/B'/Rubber oxygenase, catalytic domain